MCEIDKLIIDIDKLRGNLERLIMQKKGNLLDRDIQEASRVLNEMINQYNKILEDKMIKK
jgi:hypothetical protein